MNEEQLKVLVEALEKLDWVQWVKRKMAEEAASQSSTEQLSDQPSDKIDPEKAKKILEEGKVNGQPLTEDQRKMFAAAASREQNSDPALRERYHQLEQQVERHKTELAAVRQALEQERADRTNAERYSQLMALRQAYAFDLDKEMERCRASRMSDELFRDHLNLIRENYRRIPVGDRLPPLGQAIDPDDPRERYSEEVRQKALRIALQKRQNGEAVDYEALLEQVKTGQVK